MRQLATAIKVSEAMKEVKAFEWEGDYQWPARPALKAFGRFARRWQGRYPKAVRCVREDLESLLEFYSFPA